MAAISCVMSCPRVPAEGRGGAAPFSTRANARCRTPEAAGLRIPRKYVMCTAVARWSAKLKLDAAAGGYTGPVETPPGPRTAPRLPDGRARTAPLRRRTQDRRCPGASGEAMGRRSPRSTCVTASTRALLGGAARTPRARCDLALREVALHRESRARSVSDPQATRRGERAGDDPPERQPGREIAPK